MTSTIRSKSRKVLLSAAVLFFWLLLWEIISLIVDTELIFASPVSTAKTLASLLLSVSFWRVCALSFLRIISGFALGVIFGVLCGALSSVKIFGALVSPLMTIVRCVPVASFIILTWFFMSREQVPVFTSFLMVTPIMWGNIRKGTEGVQSDYLDVASVYSFSRAKKLRLIYIPSVKPYFSAGIMTSLGLSWKAGIAAEVLCRPQYSIGNEIFLTKSYLETPTLFAWTTVVVIFSVILEKLLKKVFGGENDKG